MALKVSAKFLKAEALDTLVVVANQAARFALTTATVQNGDFVKQTDTGVVYFVSDQTNLGSAAGYTQISITGNAGDIPQTSFTAANNQSSPANITGFAFANASVRSFNALVSVTIVASTSLYQMFEIKGVQKGSSWTIVTTAVGDISGVDFSITSAGQVQYTSTNVAGFTSSTIKFSAATTSV